jgi:polyisoprenoid-binding protein YceI
MTTSHIETLPGYRAGSWTIDPVHSEVGFSARHMMVSKVRGKFRAFEGKILTGTDVLDSSVTGTVDLTSIDTGNKDRDDHIRSADFFDVAAAGTMTFASTSVVASGDDYLVVGDLTLKGVTRSVTFELEVGGFGPDAYGGTRCGFTATTTLNRRDYGVDFSAAMETGGVVVGDKITVQLEIEAVLDVVD